MSKCMRAIIKCLGVEVGEVFKITDAFNNKSHRYFRFTETDIEISDDGVTWERAKAIVLKCLLMGDARIIKLPWNPAVYDEYYYPIPSDRDLWESRLWIGDNYDNSRFSRGLVCKTKKEAIDMAKKMLAVVKEEQK